MFQKIQPEYWIYAKQSISKIQPENRNYAMQNHSLFYCQAYNGSVLIALSSLWLSLTCIRETPKTQLFYLKELLTRAMKTLKKLKQLKCRVFWATLTSFGQSGYTSDLHINFKNPGMVSVIKYQCNRMDTQEINHHGTQPSKGTG